MCEKHYHRMYRHGDVHAKARSTKPKQRYRLAVGNFAGHPLCPPCGRVYEHRLALFDAIGYGPHWCHWCGVSVQWQIGGDGLQADHMDGDKRNNHASNLVPSCPTCNAGRASFARYLANLKDGLWSGPGADASFRAQAPGARLSPSAVELATEGEGSRRGTGAPLQTLALSVLSLPVNT